jgi:hypothetical protein
MNVDNNDPFEGFDTSDLSEADKAEIEKLRQIYQSEGKDGLVSGLTEVARNNSPLFMKFLAAILD